MNSIGTGAYSGEANAIPATVPGATNELIATSGYGYILLIWQVPSSNGGATITGYKKREDNDDVNQWFDDVLPKWQRSQLYKELPKFTWKTRDDIPRMATRLYYDSHAKLPGDWNWSNLKQVLLEAFPQNVSAPMYYFKTIARVMMNFCSFLHESQALQNLAGMKEKIQKLSPKICERIEATRAWSSGKKYFF